MLNRPEQRSDYVLQKSRDIPEQVESVCAMSVYREDRLRWLKRAVESVLQQSQQPTLFVIVVDGYVPDYLSEYISKLAREEPSVIVFWGQTNRGLSACMNFVIEWSIKLKPQYFFRMDADDICAPQRFERQLALLQKHQDVDVLGSALWEINEDGIQVGKRCLPTRHDVLIRSFSRRCPINHPTVVIRYRVFEKGYRYHEDMLNTQDYFFWIDLAAAGFKFANIKEPLLYFRRINGFYKRRGRSKSLNEFKARMYAMSRLNQHSLTNWCYAIAVLALRMMPSIFIRMAYKVDRTLLERFGRN
jgi:glycosyltransferase involved in cell wall biosynthesis